MHLMPGCVALSCGSGAIAGPNQHHRPPEGELSIVIGVLTPLCCPPDGWSLEVNDGVVPAHAAPDLSHVLWERGRDRQGLLVAADVLDNNAPGMEERQRLLLLLFIITCAAESAFLLWQGPCS